MDDNTMNNTYPDYDTNFDYNTTSSDPSLLSNNTTSFPSNNTTSFPSNTTSLPSDTTFPTSFTSDNLFPSDIAFPTSFTSDNLFPSDIAFPDNSLFDNNAFAGNDYVDADSSDILNPNYYSGNSYINDPLNVTYSGTGTNYMDFDNIISSYTGTNEDNMIRGTVVYNGGGNNIGTYTGYAMTGINQKTFYKKDNECDYRGKWGSDEINIIKKCNECVSNNGFYGEKQYFCDGSCISRYKQAVCPATGLVATNLEQCKNPCYKTPPRTNGFCNDDFDCDVKEQCYKDKNFYKGIKGVCLQKENYKFIGVI